MVPAIAGIPRHSVSNMSNGRIMTFDCSDSFAVFRLALLEHLHCAHGHRRPVEILAALVRLNVFWHSMEADVQAYVQSCSHCLTPRPSAQQRLAQAVDTYRQGILSGKLSLDRKRRIPFLSPPQDIETIYVEELLRDSECPQCFSYFAPKH